MSRVSEAVAVAEHRCPVCGAVPGKRCVKLSASARGMTVDRDGAAAGEWRAHPHPERRDVPLPPQLRVIVAVDPKPPIEPGERLWWHGPDESLPDGWRFARLDEYEPVPLPPGRPLTLDDLPCVLPCGCALGLGIDNALTVAPCREDCPTLGALIGAFASIGKPVEWCAGPEGVD